MATDAYYASGRIATLSLKLWTRDKLARLQECSNVDAAIRMLTESGFGGGATVDGDFENLLQKELDDSVAFLKEMSPDPKVTNCFLLTYDYTNAKVMMKCKYMRSEPVNLYRCGLYDVDEMWARMQQDDYQMLSEEMQQALNDIDLQFVEGNRYPSVIDKILDRAYFKELARRNRFVTLNSVKKYWRLNADIANVMLLLRSKRANILPDASDFVVGGNVKPSFFAALTKADFDEINSAFSKTHLAELVALGTIALKNGESFAPCVAAGEELKRASLIEGKDNFTAEAVICYFLSKTTEIDNIRSILVCLKNNISASSNVRLKEQYV